MDLPKSLSATSVEVLETCFSRWVEEYRSRAEQPGKEAANLGSACHYALEHFVGSGYHLNHKKNYDSLLELYTAEYERLFSDRSMYDDGVVMLHNWWERMEWTDRTVLSTEQKASFTIKVTHDGVAHEIPFNYIWDRCDLVDGPHSERGETWVEVVDYKTIRKPMSPAGLADKIQARCYGLAAQIAYPQADRVWVTFDLLRYDPVGIVFTREQNVATYRYLQRVVHRILAADEDEARKSETLNQMCHWCIRKQDCEALTKHVDAGGILGITDPAEMAARRFLLECQKKGVTAAMDEIDRAILTHMEANDILEFATDELEVAATVSRKRYLDSERAMHIVGPELIAEYGNLGVTAIDKMLKDSRLTDEQKDQLRALIRTQTGEPRVKVTPKNPID